MIAVAQKYPGMRMCEKIAEKYFLKKSTKKPKKKKKRKSKKWGEEVGKTFCMERKSTVKKEGRFMHFSSASFFFFLYFLFSPLCVFITFAGLLDAHRCAEWSCT
jgi:hypothetical protein